MDLDDVLPHVGDWNKYQHLLLWVVLLPACIPCGFTAFNQVFMDLSPTHWCRVPELIEADWSVAQRKAASIPKSVTLQSLLTFLLPAARNLVLHFRYLYCDLEPAYL